MRSRLSSSQRCLAATCVRRSTCWVAQPPHMPKCGHFGSRRAAEASMTRTRRATSNLRLAWRTSASTRSPASAPSTKATLPSGPRATPWPAASSALTSSISPALKELAPVRLALLFQGLPQHFLLFCKHVFRQNPSQELEAQEKQVRVDRVDLAVVADLREPALEVGFPDCRAADADLAREPGELRHHFERRVVARLVH